MKLSNKQLHNEGVKLVLANLPDTHMHSALGKNFDYVNSDTDLIIKNGTSKNIYEMRIAVTHEKIDNDNQKISWMLMQHNVESVHPNFFYGFLHIDRTTEPTTNRLFIVPSKVISDYIKSNFDTTENGKKKFYNFTINLSNKKTDLQVIDNYEDRWDLLK